MPYNKALAISYQDRRDLAVRIVQLKPDGYSYFRLGKRLSPKMQVVEFTNVKADALSITDLAKDLGVYVPPVKAEEPVRYLPREETRIRANQGQVGLVILRGNTDRPHAGFVRKPYTAQDTQREPDLRDLWHALREMEPIV